MTLRRGLMTHINVFTFYYPKNDNLRKRLGRKKEPIEWEWERGKRTFVYLLKLNFLNGVIKKRKRNQIDKGAVQRSAVELMDGWERNAVGGD
jgi:hypothetical protein